MISNVIDYFIQAPFHFIYHKEMNPADFIVSITSSPTTTTTSLLNSFHSISIELIDYYANSGKLNV